MDTVPTAPVALHALPPSDDLLLGVLVVGAAASALVVALAAAALARRRSWSYLLVTLALSTLLARAAVGALTLDGTVDPAAHHVLEHGLDVVTVALLLGAVYCARGADPRGDVGP